MDFELKGVWVPLVTPLRDGKLDIASLRRLCTHLLEQGVDGLVACGTTGEAPALSEAERSEIIACVADISDHRCIAGAGTVGTKDTIRLVRRAAMGGASGVLVITPYFVAPTQEEIEDHFRTVAQASLVPVVLYNFPARAGVGIEAATALRLADHANIAGIKQSVPDLSPDLQETIVGAPEGFSVVVGSAPLLWPALAIGAAGGILAAAHVEARSLLRIVSLARSGDVEAARRLHRELWPRLRLIDGPAPVKRHLYEDGIIYSPEMRAPLRPA